MLLGRYFEAPSAPGVPLTNRDTIVAPRDVEGCVVDGVASIVNSVANESRFRRAGGYCPNGLKSNNQEKKLPHSSAYPLLVFRIVLGGVAVLLVISRGGQPRPIGFPSYGRPWCGFFRLSHMLY